MHLFNEFVIWRSSKLEAGDHFFKLWEVPQKSTARGGCSVLIYALLHPLICIKKEKTSQYVYPCSTHNTCAHHTRRHTCKAPYIRAHWRGLSLHVTGRRAPGLIWAAVGSQPLLFHQHLLTTLSKSHCMPCTCLGALLPLEISSARHTVMKRRRAKAICIVCYVL